MKLAQFKKGKYFFQKKKFFLDSGNIIFFIAWGGVHRPGDEKLVTLYIKKQIMAPFYGSGSTTAKLEPLRGGSLLFTTKFPESPGPHFIDLRRMKS